MKRSQINRILKESISFVKDHQIYLPPFADWTVSDWKHLDGSYSEILDNMLGWDVTDFGTDKFANLGLVAFTFRNGNYQLKNKYPKPYCEKLLILDEGQELPYHFHRLKEEDTINRGGGNLQLTVFNSTTDEQLDQQNDVNMVKDGRKIIVPAGSVITLHPGESLTTTQGIYHKWDVEPGTGKVLVWEVSSTNDDNIDNRFLDPVPRIPNIVEDEDPYRLLFGDYQQLQ